MQIIVFQEGEFGDQKMMISLSLMTEKLELESQ